MPGRKLNRGRSAGNFRHASGRTRAINVAPKPTRGGYRL